MNNDDAIWVKMKKEISGESKDIFIGTCYLNPSQAKGTDKKVSRLAEDIITLQDKGEVIIIGDLNARTGNLDDTITPDKSDEKFDLCFSNPPPKRNSRDIEKNQRGIDLIELCKSVDLQIANGRKTGDIFGDFTCIQYNGNSVVDYLITSPAISKSIPCLKVGTFSPWLSDHCPVSFTLEVKNIIQDTNLSKKNPKKKVQNNIHGLRIVKMIIFP